MVASTQTTVDAITAAVLSELDNIYTLSKIKNATEGFPAFLAG